MTADLQIEIILDTLVSEEDQKVINEVDRLAFAGESHGDPEFNSIDWSARIEYMALGRVDGELVTQLCLPKREIWVGAEKVWVAGIGGMATHPDHQHQGYGSALLRATESFMRAEMHVPFGLLICDYETRPFYELTRWQFAADRLYFTQDNQRRTLTTCVMVLSLEKHVWRAGEIDLCGSPW